MVESGQDDFQLVLDHSLAIHLGFIPSGVPHPPQHQRFKNSSFRVNQPKHIFSVVKGLTLVRNFPVLGLAVLVILRFKSWMFTTVSLTAA